MLSKLRKFRRLKKRILIPQKVYCNEVQCIINAFFIVIGLDAWLAQIHATDTTRHMQHLRSGKSGSSRNLPKSNFKLFVTSGTCMSHLQSFQVSWDNSIPLFLHAVIYLEVSLFR